MSKKKLSYQDAFDELTGIVQQVEDGTVDIDQLSDLIERANYLTKYCREKLHEVDRKVKNSVDEHDEQG